jgi:hypothetical protein
MKQRQVGKATRLLQTHQQQHWKKTFHTITIFLQKYTGKKLTFLSLETGQLAKTAETSHFLEITKRRI